jgi:hypothetical protein
MHHSTRSSSRNCTVIAVAIHGVFNRCSVAREIFRISWDCRHIGGSRVHSKSRLFPYRSLQISSQTMPCRAAFEMMMPLNWIFQATLRRLMRRNLQVYKSSRHMIRLAVSLQAMCCLFCDSIVLESTFKNHSLVSIQLNGR